MSARRRELAQSDLNLSEQALRAAPTDPKLLAGRAKDLGRVGRFREALEDYAKAIDGGSPDHMWLYHAACMRLYLGDQRGYRADAQRMLREFAGVNDAHVSDRTAKTCLLAPTPIPLEALRPLVERSSPAGAPTGLLLKGIFEYRAGRFETAVDLLLGARQLDWASERPATASFYIAMAQHRLGRPDLAADAMTRGLARMRAFVPPPDQGDLGTESLEDWLICQIVQREAEAVLGAKAAAGRRLPAWIWADEASAAVAPSAVASGPATSQPITDPSAPAGERFFRRTFILEGGGAPTRAELTAVGDDHFVIYANGRKVLEGPPGLESWRLPRPADVARYLKPGRNVLAVAATNDATADGEHNPAGVLVRLVVEGKGGAKAAPHVVVSDGQWKASDRKPDGWDQPGFDSGWKPAREVAPLGLGPWGELELDPPPTLEERQGRTTWGPATVPGVVQAEDFDGGGEGVAYHDLTPANVGPHVPPYRKGSVDIEHCFDEGGGANVCSSYAGEWLRYTIDVVEDGRFDLELRVAAEVDGGVLHVEIDDRDVAGRIDVPKTGGWQNWQTVTAAKGVPLSKGRHVVRVVLGAAPAGRSDICNLNWIALRGAGKR